MNLTSLSTVINKKVRQKQKIASALRREDAAIKRSIEINKMINKIITSTLLDQDMEAFRKRHYKDNNSPL
jgi:hypothetical protein